MLGREQIEKLNEMIENYAEAFAISYHTDDVATSFRQEEDARLAKVAAETELQEYIQSLSMVNILAKAKRIEHNFNQFAGTSSGGPG